MSYRLSTVDGGGASLVLVAAAGQVLETGEPALERQLDVADGAVALLADDDLGDAGLLGLVLVVDLVAVDEHDDVGVLLDGARVVADDAVGEPRRRPRNGEIEDLLLAGGDEGDDAVPAEVGRGLRD